MQEKLKRLPDKQIFNGNIVLVTAGSKIHELDRIIVFGFPFA